MVRCYPYLKVGSRACDYNRPAQDKPGHQLIALDSRHHPAHGSDHEAAQDRLNKAEFHQPSLMGSRYGRADKAPADECQRSKLRGGQIRGIGHAFHSFPILPPP